MKKILLPTDFSDNALNAIQYAVQFLQEEPCEFHLLHTFTPAAYNVGFLGESYSAFQLQDIMKKSAEKDLKAIKKELIETYKNKKHTFKTSAVFNLLIAEMQEIINNEAIHMVIMGTKGATGAKEIFIGTHTTYAFKKLNVPVLAIPSGARWEPLQDILFPTDFKFHKSNPYLQILKDISANHDSEIHILNVYYNEPLSEEQRYNKIFLNEYFNHTPHLFHIEENTDVIGAIDAYAGKSTFNMLVMITNKHFFFENLMFKNVINQIAYHIGVPFLVLPS